MLPSSRGINSYLVDLKTSVFPEINFEYEDVECKSPAGSIREKVKLTIVPKDTKLYQGAVYRFKTELSKEEMVQDYFENYYDKRHKGSYFVSSSKVADMYGKDRDESRIVYAAMPDAENQTINQQFLYPICYIPGIKGSRITYATNARLKLLDISNYENAVILWIITQDFEPDRKEDIQDILLNSVFDYRSQETPNGIPLKLRRNSSEWDDPLVDFFRDYVIPYVQKVYSQKLDGYVYHEMDGNDFHDEIMLVNKDVLDFRSVETNSPTEYPGLIPVEEWKCKHRNQMVKNDQVFRNAITLTPLRNNPYKEK